ncbi:transposase [uncultured Selenomonas sp.]|uniref:transposase n=1 Tax=uncultured Selenomonas sp. TaxID=159275 RepID=UPI00345D8E36
MSSKQPTKTAHAYAMRMNIQETYAPSADCNEAQGCLKNFCRRMMHSSLEPMKKFCRTIRSRISETWGMTQENGDLEL